MNSHSKKGLRLAHFQKRGWGWPILKGGRGWPILKKRINFRQPQKWEIPPTPP